MELLSISAGLDLLVSPNRPCKRPNPRDVQATCRWFHGLVCPTFEDTGTLDACWREPNDPTTSRVLKSGLAAVLSPLSRPFTDVHRPAHETASSARLVSKPSDPGESCLSWSVTHATGKTVNQRICLKRFGEHPAYQAMNTKYQQEPLSMESGRRYMRESLSTCCMPTAAVHPQKGHRGTPVEDQLGG